MLSRKQDLNLKKTLNLNHKTFPFLEYDPYPKEDTNMAKGTQTSSENNPTILKQHVGE